MVLCFEFVTEVVLTTEGCVGLGCPLELTHNKEAAGPVKPRCKTQV